MLIGRELAYGFVFFLYFQYNTDEGGLTSFGRKAVLCELKDSARIAYPTG